MSYKSWLKQSLLQGCGYHLVPARSPMERKPRGPGQVPMDMPLTCCVWQGLVTVLPASPEELRREQAQSP